jgi:drug/metabolite transporter (DMT)-like permease
MRSRDQRIALAAFVVGSLLAGGNAVGVRFSNRELEPFWGATLRFAVAAVVLVGIVLVRRLELPRGRALVGAILYGLFNFGGAFALSYYGLVRVHAGLGQTILALVPLLTLLLAVAHRQEAMRMAALVGTVLALAGIAAMSGVTTAVGLPLLSILAIVGSAACFAEAAVLVRMFPQADPITRNAVGMATGTVFLLAITLVAGDVIELPERGATWAALTYMVLVGSVLVFVLYLVLLRYWVASRASYVFVVIPVVTFVLSAWLDQEPIGWNVVIGAVLVLAGVYVGALRRTRDGAEDADGSAADPREGVPLGTRRRTAD